MLGSRLVSLALLFEALHEGVELRLLLRREDGADAGMRLLADGLVLLTIRFVLRGPFRPRLVDDGSELGLLIGRKLQLAGEVVNHLGARRRAHVRRPVTAAAPDALSPEVVADSADEQAEHKDDEHQYRRFPPRSCISGFHFWSLPP